MELHAQNTSSRKMVQQLSRAQPNNIQLSRTQPNIQCVNRQLQQQLTFSSQPQQPPMFQDQISCVSQPSLQGLQQQLRNDEFVVSPPQAPPQFHQQPPQCHKAIIDKRFRGSPPDQNGMINQQKILTDTHDPSYEELLSAWNKYSLEVDKIYKTIFGSPSPSPGLAKFAGDFRVHANDTSKALRITREEYNALSRDEKQNIVKRVKKTKVVIDKYNNKTASSRQPPQPPGNQSQTPPDQQQMNMKLQRSEAAATSPRIPAQHIISSSQAMKINPDHAVRSMDQQTRHQMFQTQNINQPIQQTLQKKIGDVSKLGQVVRCPPRIVQQQHSAVNSPQTSGKASASVDYSLGHAKDARNFSSNIDSPRQHRQPPPPSEAAATSPRLPAQHIPSNSQANKINPSRSLRSMDEQTRHQMFQTQNVNQPIQKTFQKNISNVNGPNLGQVVQTGPGILQQQHPAVSSSQLHRENRASQLSTVAVSPRPVSESVEHSQPPPPPASQSQIRKQMNTIPPKPKAADTSRLAGQHIPSNSQAKKINPARSLRSMDEQTRHQMFQTQNVNQPIQKTFQKNISNVNGPNLGQVVQTSQLRKSPHVNVNSPQTSRQASSQLHPENRASPLSTVASDPNGSCTSSSLSPSLVNVEDAQRSAQDAQNLSETTNENQDSSKILAPEENHKGISDEPPLQRLLDAFKSMSNKALCATSEDIGSVMDMDTVDGKCGYPVASSRRMKRQFGVISVPADHSTSEGIQGLRSQANDLESPTATHRTKMPKFQYNTTNLLLDEIKETNKRLLETTLDVVLDSTKTASSTDFGEGTVIQFSYTPAGNIEMRKSASRLFPLFCAQLLVPADYPESSPVLLNDDLLCGFSNRLQICNLTKKVQTRFSSSLCELPQPPSLKEMARKWDDCARSVVTEFAATTGGGAFSTKYGKWENIM